MLVLQMQKLFVPLTHLWSVFPFYNPLKTNEKKPLENLCVMGRLLFLSCFQINFLFSAILMVLYGSNGIK